ncbi:MAG: hypothetical protein BEN19_07885 [Epulopiscium sp. Nuni2H_MBin003]|nr:MAG: hypothetical protein BEN19_07885 [Epulopiscium sp. Nuni2H_MBin003]
MEMDKQAILEEKKEEAIESLKEYLPNLENGLIYILNQFHSKDYAGANKTIIEALEGIKWVLDIMIVTNPQDLDAENINDILNAFIDAMENDDKETIVDIIEYELIDLVKEWNNIIS